MRLLGDMNKEKYMYSTCTVHVLAQSILLEIYAVGFYTNALQ
jgi:hypothetical protein